MNEAVRVGAARVALRALWTVSMPSSGVFGDSRIRLDGEADACDEVLAAERVAALAGRVVLRADDAGGDVLHVIVTQLEADPHRSERADPRPPSGLEFLRWKSAMNVLVLAAGHAYKLSPTTAEHLVRTYRLMPSPSGGGGPPDDPWASQLKLPPHWLSGCGLVWMLGRHDSRGIKLPMRQGDEWNPDSLVVV